MSLTVKVSITEAWGDDGKGWVAEVKDFGLTANAKTFEKAIEQIQPKIEAYLQQMFGTEKRVVASVGAATAKVEFEIDVQKDRTLGEFTIAPSKDDDTSITITCDGRPPIKTNLEQIKLAKKTLGVSAQTGIPPETLIKMVKTKGKKKPGAD